MRLLHLRLGEFPLDSSVIYVTGSAYKLCRLRDAREQHLARCNFSLPHLKSPTMNERFFNLYYFGAQLLKFNFAWFKRLQIVSKSSSINPNNNV